MIPSPPSSQNTAFKRTKTQTNLNILYIEDNKITSILLYKLFSNFSFNITCINNGSDALEYLNNNINSTDIILLDYYLPDMNATQILYLINELIKKYKLTKSPFIIITSSSIIPSISQSLINSNYCFISKPFNKQTVDIITEIINPR